MVSILGGQTISEAEYARNYMPLKVNITNNSTPEEIFSKYNLKDMSDKDYHQMESDLWSSSNVDSSYLGMQMVCDDMSAAFVANCNKQPEQLKVHFNCLQSVEDKYKMELSAGDTNEADFYRKFYQFMSETAVN